jgi:hypothetical protein
VIVITSLAFIPVSECALAVTVSIAAVTRVFIIPLALLLRLTGLMGLPSRGLSSRALGEANGHARDQKCRRHQ